MTDPARLHQQVAAAIVHIDWCTTIPHTLAQVIGIYAEATANAPRPMGHGKSNAELVDTIRSQASGRFGKGGHSDPTPEAALRNHPEASDDGDETLGAMRAAVALIGEAAEEVDHRCADALGLDRWHPPTLGGSLTSTLTGATARLHHATPNLSSACHVEDLGHLIGWQLLDTAAWLHDKAEGIWLASKGESLPVAKQQAIAPCTHCGPWRSGTIAQSQGLCEQCREFQRQHKCKPTEPIVRRWEISKQATPGMILDAKATSRRKVKVS